MGISQSTLDWTRIKAQPKLLLNEMMMMMVPAIVHLVRRLFNDEIDLQVD